MTREEKILFYLPYVQRLSSTLCHLRGITDYSFREDCCSAAVEAMIRAVDEYDKASTASISTWIAKGVDWAIRELLRCHFGSRRHGSSIHDLKAPRLSLQDIEDWSQCGVDGTEQFICDLDLARKVLKYAESRGSSKGKGDVLRKYFVEGYTMREIAIERNCSESNISLMISRLKSDINNRFKKSSYIGDR